ncbi:NADP-dependent oxidoreductase [Siccirubricoccus deserti]|uniref:NADP-dependent oxidoreductase n=1 Tax=Siccirubricoccus deserti TaxID=2013562 RepID=A0A9X0QY04_9PROT|nr:NADP-dependent oxidoreductase [Siccirubricoccus deserti]MBC4015919.1 NADP-dependent oxidoreductase [Siccirubricoccus deserti]GGC39175.1 NADP-dependent oxidoreductase [Siccirubricoccus deserti]
MAETNLQVLLRRRPKGEPVPEDFEIVETPVPEPKEGEVLVRAGYLSLDPYMRGRMAEAKSYAKPVELGAVMEGRTAGEVVASRAPGFAPGDTVAGGYGWQRFSVVKAAGLIKVDSQEAPLSANLGVLGMPGLTAWVGLEDIGTPKPGETMVVSAASGAVGQVVGQIGKLRGCKVIGIAGGPEKCRYVTEELGFDACLDHRGDLDAQLDAACPEGIDVYWENVGGAVQAAVFPRFRDFGRMVMCGVISQYNVAEGADSFGGAPGPNLGPVVRKRLRIQGFIVSDNGWPRYPAFRKQMLGWMAEGRMVWKEDVVQGLRNAPQAFIGLLKGRNFGKLVVQVD